jgi:alkylhydroperoxidase family enzyme
MARVKHVNSPNDYPGTADEETKRDLTEFFKQLFPGSENPRIDSAHSGFAIAAQSPKMALHLFSMSRYFVLEMAWSKRRDLLELAVQTLNLKYRCESSFEAHLPHAKANGISAELQSALPYWRTSSLFNDEQRLVIEFTEAVVEGEVSEALFSRAVERFGERGTIEFSAAVAWWSFWAMLLNATRDPILP